MPDASTDLYIYIYLRARASASINLREIKSVGFILPLSSYSSPPSCTSSILPIFIVLFPSTLFSSLSSSPDPFSAGILFRSRVSSWWNRIYDIDTRQPALRKHYGMIDFVSRFLLSAHRKIRKSKKNGARSSGRYADSTVSLNRRTRMSRTGNKLALSFFQIEIRK